MGQRADRVEAEIAPKLCPDFAAHVADDRRLEARLRESLRHAKNPFAFRTVKLGEREAIAFDVTNDARPLNFRRRIDDARDDSLDRQIVGDDAAGIDALQANALMGSAMAEKIPPGNAVLRRQHHRLRAHDGGQLAHDGGDLMGLHAEDDQVLLAGVGDAVRSLDARDDLAAVLDQNETILNDARKMSAPRDHADVLAGMGELRRQQTAYRASADHAYSH